MKKYQDHLQRPHHKSLNRKNSRRSYLLPYRRSIKSDRTSLMRKLQWLVKQANSMKTSLNISHVHKSKYIIQEWLLPLKKKNTIQLKKSICLLKKVWKHSSFLPQLIKWKWRSCHILILYLKDLSLLREAVIIQSNEFICRLKRRQQVRQYYFMHKMPPFNL